MSNRIYRVTRNGGENRLVRAANKSQAISYCARHDYHAEVASQEALVGLRHIAVETAGEQEAPSLPVNQTDAE